MKTNKDTFNVLENIEKHIKMLKPLLPKQAIVCIGEYPIKTLLNADVNKERVLSILIEKSSDEIYKWLPKGYNPHFVLGFEDANIDTHFWYTVFPAISKDDSVVESLKMESVEKLQSAILFSSIWDGIGSASLPTLIKKCKASNIDSLSIAVLPSKIQPTDAHFNTYAALKMCSNTDGATILLMDRDQIESYEGVDRNGDLIKGNMVVNYLLNLFLAKDALIEEISELSRTFNAKLFTPLVVTGASYMIYSSLENMLNTALLKPFLKFDLSKATLLYAILRMPSILKDKLPRGKVELAITNWFKEKTNLQSIYITEPVYTEDMTDRTDVVLFVGGFDLAEMFSDLETKVKSLKNQAVDRGFITSDWQVVSKMEEAKITESGKTDETSATTEVQNARIDETQIIAEALNAKESEKPNNLVKPKRVRRTKKASQTRKRTRKS
jgi:hypothetical protein